MSGREDSDSEAPEEFTSEQGIKQDEEIRKIQKENKARVVHEGKERRRLWAQRKTPRPSKGGEGVKDAPKRGEGIKDASKGGKGTKDVLEAETDVKLDSMASGGMLPNDIVQLLAAREKKVFLSDSDDEKSKEKPHPRKKKLKSSGVETVILKDRSVSPCLQNSLEFLKKKKMQVPRSSSVLNNSNQALRFISSSGLLSKN